MELSLSQVATLLGQSERQIRYRIKKGEIKGTKVGREWRFAPDDLPLTQAQRERLLERAGAVVQAAEEATAVVVQSVGDGKRRYSVTDLQAYKVGAPLYHRIVEAGGLDDAAAVHMRRCLDLLARGCHAFHGEDKRGHYAAAREQAASAIIDLLLHAPPDATRHEIAEAIEQHLLGPLSALIRRAERKSRGNRFTQFGAASSR